LKNVKIIKHDAKIVIHPMLEIVVD